MFLEPIYRIIIGLIAKLDNAIVQVQFGKIPKYSFSIIKQYMPTHFQTLVNNRKQVVVVVASLDWDIFNTEITSSRLLSRAFFWLTRALPESTTITEM